VFSRLGFQEELNGVQTVFTTPASLGWLLDTLTIAWASSFRSYGISIQGHHPSLNHELFRFLTPKGMSTPFEFANRD